MRISIISHSDSTGGAAIACRRLAEAMISNGEDVRLVCLEKKTKNNFVVGINNSRFSGRIAFIRYAIEYLFFNKLKKNKGKESLFSPGWLGADITRLSEIRNADILNLHWINNSFLSLKNLKSVFELNKPIVWHLHDMWVFTGGCHYSGDCIGYNKECGNCPYLDKPSSADLSNKIWKAKQEIFKGKKLIVITPSEWLANLARNSGLLKGREVYCIPNPINTNIFTPVSKYVARKELLLDPQKKYILFTSMNISHKRKGFDYFNECIRKLVVQDEFVTNVELLVVGKYNDAMVSVMPEKIKVNFLGPVSEERKMALIYCASDLYVTPSLEDNLPNTIMESMACGTPVVGFNTGGIPELIDHKKNGFVAEYRSVSHLEEGIRWILFNADYNHLSLESRKKIVNNYSYETVSSKYRKVMEGVMGEGIS